MNGLELRLKLSRKLPSFRKFQIPLSSSILSGTSGDEYYGSGWLLGGASDYEELYAIDTCRRLIWPSINIHHAIFL